jgi:hypothetical protein
MNTALLLLLTLNGPSLGKDAPWLPLPPAQPAPPAPPAPAIIYDPELDPGHHRPSLFRRLQDCWIGVNTYLSGAHGVPQVAPFYDRKSIPLSIGPTPGYAAPYARPLSPVDVDNALPSSTPAASPSGPTLPPAPTPPASGTPAKGGMPQ